MFKTLAFTVSARRPISSPRLQSAREKRYLHLPATGILKVSISLNGLVQFGQVIPMETPTEKLDAALIFAPAGELVPKALQAVDKGGTVVCGGIHMSDIPSFPYSILWEERTLLSVANLTRADADEFMRLLEQIPVKTDVQFFSLIDANVALAALRSGSIKGAAVLVVD